MDGEFSRIQRGIQQEKAIADVRLAEEEIQALREHEIIARDYNDTIKVSSFIAGQLIEKNVKHDLRLTRTDNRKTLFGNKTITSLYESGWLVDASFGELSEAAFGSHQKVTGALLKPGGTILTFSHEFRVLIPATMMPNELNVINTVFRNSSSNYDEVGLLSSEKRVAPNIKKGLAHLALRNNIDLSGF